MFSAKKTPFLVLIVVCLLSVGHCESTNDGLNLYKDFLAADKLNNASPVNVEEEDYVQLLPTFYGEIDPSAAANKRSSSKFKNYMLGKDAETNPVGESTGPIIRSYIPRTSSKRGPGALLNWAFTPQQQQRAGRFYSGYYRSQALHRPAALE